MGLTKIFSKNPHIPKLLIYLLFALLILLVFVLGMFYQGDILDQRIEKINKERTQFKNRVKELTKDMEDFKKSQKEASPSQEAKTPKTEAEPPPEVITPFPAEWVTFKSAFLNFSFEYPVTWGEVIESIRDATALELRFSEQKSGKIYTIIFTNKKTGVNDIKVERSMYSLIDHTLPTAYAQGFSQEIEPGCPGECCDSYNDYSDTETKVEVAFNNFSLLDACSHRFVGTTCQPRDSKNGAIYFHLPGRQLAGVRLIIPTLSEKGLKKLSDLVKTDVCNPGDASICGAQSCFPKAEEKQIEIKGMLKSGESLDEESKVNLKIFNRIAESARIY